MNRTPQDPAPGFASRNTFPDLDAAYRRQLETLVRVRRAVAAVATSRKKLELRLSQLEQESSKPEGEPTSEVREVRRQLDAARDEERRVSEASRGLQAKISAMHSAQVAVEEAYAAAEKAAKETLAEVIGHT
jgi:phage shock protein A